jgi:tryptophan synthase beta subunit
MQLDELEQLFNRLPRKNIGFYPTSFHKLENLSRARGINLFLKREDMAGLHTGDTANLFEVSGVVGDFSSDTAA